MKLTTYELVLCAFCAAVTCILAPISVPLAGEVPISLATFAVLLSGILLGGRFGAISQLVYVLLGSVGVPGHQPACLCSARQRRRSRICRLDRRYRDHTRRNRRIYHRLYSHGIRGGPSLPPLWQKCIRPPQICSYVRFNGPCNRRALYSGHSMVHGPDRNDSRRLIGSLRHPFSPRRPHQDHRCYARSTSHRSRSEKGCSPQSGSCIKRRILTSRYQPLVHPAIKMLPHYNVRQHFFTS